MIVKIIFGAVIIICTSRIGFSFANGYKKRIAQIKEMQNALTIFKNDLLFCKTPLSESFKKIVCTVSEEIGNLFLETAEKIDEGLLPNACEAWKKAIDRNLPRLSLTDGDLDILCSFGQSLGANDSAMQVNNADIAVAALEQNLVQARDDEKKYYKLFSSGGMLTGIAIALMLL